MESGSDAKTKRAYFPPTVTKLTSAQAEKLAADRTQCGHQGAADFLEALRREPRYERRWQREPEEVMHEGEGALVRRRKLREPSGRRISIVRRIEGRGYPYFVVHQVPAPGKFRGRTVPATAWSEPGSPESRSASCRPCAT